MVDESVIRSVRNYLRALVDKGIQKPYGVIYGSHATGRTHEWSDIDLIVVSNHFDPMHTRQDRDMLWIVAGRIDNRIEPIPCGAKQWEDDDSSAIIEIARREGQVIKLTEDA